MDDPTENERFRMVREQIVGRGIDEPRLLEAMRRVPRHLFVDEAHRKRAYADSALPIAIHQTISQPLMVAIMTDLLKLQGHERVLEVGTGSGYQAAILAELCAELVTIERHAVLAEAAEARLRSLGYANVQVVTGDGTQGYPPRAPYNAILVAAGAPQPPEALIHQLGKPGVLVAPIGARDRQSLFVFRKDEQGAVSHMEAGECVFVPLIGREGWQAGEYK